VAFYAWSGLEQHSNATQTVRAINQLYALTGSFDAPGGNVLFPSIPTHEVDGADLLPDAQRSKALGIGDRPLCPARFEFVTGEDLAKAALDGSPYRVHGLLNFGANLAMAHGNSARVRDALAALDFFVHADLFMSPTAEQADLVLPVTSAFEAEALMVGFGVSEEAQTLVQLRHPLVPPRGEARSDLEIVFELATRLGLGEQFWDGDIDAAFRHQLEPSGVTLERLRAEPAGVRVPLTTRHRKVRRPRRTAGQSGAAAGLPHRDPEGRALLRGAGRAWLSAATRVRRAVDQPAVPPRAGRAIPTHTDVGETAVVLRNAAPQHRDPPQQGPRSPDRGPSRHRPCPRHRGGRLGARSDAVRPDPSPREAQPAPRPRSRLRPARLVAGVRRAGTSRLPALRP
jgi:anaerobic selenocysteine-containing dehydrogenase